MSIPANERAFSVFARGELRDEILSNWRYFLRDLIDPDTGVPFTEPDIAIATAQGGRWWAEADAIDVIVGGPGQARALFLTDQIDPRTAHREWLVNFHAKLWGLDELPADGGGGYVRFLAPAGTMYPGSTVIPDAGAVTFVDESGLRYQLLLTTTATATGAGGEPGADLLVKGIDTGKQTNRIVGDKLTISANGPIASAQVGLVVLDDFAGGVEKETRQEFGDRIADRIAHKPASGNNAHFRAWARQSSTSVEKAWVYSAFKHAGSVQVVFTAKRRDSIAPDARIPSAAQLITTRAFLTPPGSPEVPQHPYVLANGPEAVQTNVVASLTMRKASAAGWKDATPWPTTAVSTAARIFTVVDQTHFTLRRAPGSADLPVGVTSPSLMVWDRDRSRFENLRVLSVTFVSGNDFDVVLDSAPEATLVADLFISPGTAQAKALSSATVAYFDSLGPGEVIDLATDSRAHRAFRWPTAAEEDASTAGSALGSTLRDLVGSSITNEVVHSISPSAPTVPVDPSNGPGLLIIRHVGYYSL